MTVLEHLSEALRLDRMERASSPVSMHIVNALSTFGSKGQDEVRKADAAARKSKAEKPQGQYRQWKPGETLGKAVGLPVSEVIESPMAPGKPQQTASKAKMQGQESRPSENKSVAIAETSIAPETETNVKMAETDFQDLLNAKPEDIPNRPTKVLERYGIEQIKTYLEISGVEIKEDSTDREIAGLLIKTMGKK